LAAMVEGSSVKSHPDIHVGLGGERIGRKGSRKLFWDFVVAAGVPPQDQVLARRVLATGGPGSAESGSPIA